MERPIFIVSSPRSGSSMLFRTLVQSPSACWIGGESHALIEGIPGLHPAQREWHSNRLTALDATVPVATSLRERFAASLRDRDGNPPLRTQTMVEKTPKNSLRVPFLAAVFPGARFLFLRRDTRQTLSSMIEAWGSGNFRTYPRLPHWGSPAWSLLLVPGWQELVGMPVEHIVAHQWATTMSILMDDLEPLGENQLVLADYADLVDDPARAVPALCTRLGLAWDRPLGDALPLSGTTVTAPEPDKWRRHEREIESIWPIVADTDRRVGRFFESRLSSARRPERPD